MTSRFPRSPEFSVRPFDGQPNPFADDQATPLRTGSDPLASPQSAEIQPYRPGEYEQTQSDRSARVLMLAAVGAVFIAAGLMVALLVAIRSSPLSTELAYCIPPDLLGLALTIPAWLLARADWRAIEAGVMPSSAARRTRFGLWCSRLSIVLGTIPLAAFAAAMVNSLLG